MSCLKEQGFCTKILFQLKKKKNYKNFLNDERSFWRVYSGKNKRFWMVFQIKKLSNIFLTPRNSGRLSTSKTDESVDRVKESVFEERRNTIAKVVGNFICVS